MPKELFPLSETTLAQASEIRESPAFCGCIRERVPNGHEATIWAKENDDSIVIERYSHPDDQKPTLTNYATVHFDERGEVDCYSGSYAPAARGLGRFIERFRINAEKQQAAQKTVSELVEFVFKSLD